MQDAAYLGVLGLVGLGLIAVAFRRRRAGRRGGVVAWALAIAATLWWAEALLGVASLVAPAPTRMGPAPWVPDALPEVAGVAVAQDLAARADPAPTVLIVGDSFAAGQGVPGPDMLGAALDRALSPPVRVLTHAAPGWSLADEFLMFATLGVKVEPEVVIWLFVYNDLGAATHPWDDFIVRRSATPRLGSALLNRLAAIDGALVVEQQTLAGYRDALDPKQPHFREAFEGLAQVAASLRAAGARPLFAPYPLLHRLDDYPLAAEHAALLAAAADAGWDTVDLLPSLTGLDATTLWVSPSDHHPNGPTHARVAEVLAQEVGTILTSVGPIPCPAYDPAVGFPKALPALCGATTGPELIAAVEQLDDVRSHALGDPRWSSRRAMELAVVAAAWAPEDQDVQQRAEELIRRIQAPTPPPATPLTR